jgi:hypothetical protein
MKVDLPTPGGPLMPTRKHEGEQGSVVAEGESGMSGGGGGEEEEEEEDEEEDEADAIDEGNAGWSAYSRGCCC